MSTANFLAMFRLFADSLVAPLVFTLWQSTIKIARLETDMANLQRSINLLYNRLEKG